jgi:hypothetical protein
MGRQVLGMFVNKVIKIWLTLTLTLIYLKPWHTLSLGIHKKLKRMMMTMIDDDDDVLSSTNF